MAVAEALDHVATRLEQDVAGGQPLEDAVKALLADLIKAHKRIIFNGNGYSDEWREEASRRGLLNLRDTVDALPQLIAPDTVAAFERFKVMSGREVRARYDVAVEAYNKTVNVEAQLMTLLANRYILPAALVYQTKVAQNVASVKAAGGTATAGERTLATLCALNDEFRTRTDELAHALEHADGDPEAHAKYFRDAVMPKMAALREVGDRIEVVVPSDVWPLPTYREMLFIK